MADNIKGEADGPSDISACGEDSFPTEMTENNRTQINGKKKKNSIIKSFRRNFQRAGEMSPLSPKNKAPNNKIDRASTGNDLGNSSDSPVQSPASPIEEQLTKQESARWKLRFGSKKENTSKQEQLEVCTEVVMSSEEKKSEVTGGTTEVWKLYFLPEIPPVPLSVMQINNLIKNNALEDAYVNILSLRNEVQCERDELGEKAFPVELLNKEKDLTLLYNNLRDKLTEIVQQSCAQPSCNKELLVQVAGIIQEEEKREKDEEKMGEWRDVWRAAIQRGVKETLKEIHLDSHEQNASWLAVHLGQVGKVIVVQLGKVKAELMSSYPPSFNVFETYVSTFHKAVGEHLKGLLEKVTEVKDYYALLDFILNCYQSEKIMGSSSLQPELKEELKTLKLDNDFLDQIKNAYCNRLQADVRSSLDNIIKLEHDEMWKDKNKPQINEELYLSHIHMDILTYITGPVQASSMLDVELEHRVMCCCLHELKEFPKRFEKAFVQWNKTLLDPTLWAEYHITYINSFRNLKEQIESYRQKCPSQVEQLAKEINGLVNILSQALLEHFKTDTKPLLKMMMTRKWLSSEEDFQQLHKRIETLSQQCKHMSPQHAQEFVSDVHYFVVREYISQLMKNNYSCKNRKNEKAATKIRVQWSELCELFQEMNSVQHWLYPVGDHLQKIIGERKESEIKNYLQPLVDDYPDFSKKHLSAVLYFRGVTRGRQRQMILQKLSDLKQHANAGSVQHVLFNGMEATASTDLVNMPCACLFPNTGN
ncbi:exocyst complex component 3-like protein 4 isoform X1 [Pangasianodon hypophthalmus]|uniref:exocyst complex component 3-like protein 4 isoform X1 n=1 Tax=Pangasianodon hypophthalmus TaxID=310915 RepID=UPI002307F1F8|nr:exocyst complex component 3-like protein 4 isoform X1 [Pangasianodon hypophthalmus]XP_053088960.1 exocyst complex component 3-like protein 4 isoform X1 [Pangasianodon hypophthalmus]